VFTLVRTHPAGARGCGQLHQPDRLSRYRAARPGDTGDRYRKIDRRMREHPHRHGFGGLATHRAMPRQRHRRNAEHLAFGFVAISDKAALEHVRRARNLRSESTRLNSSHEWISYAV